MDISSCRDLGELASVTSSCEDGPMSLPLTSYVKNSVKTWTLVLAISDSVPMISMISIIFAATRQHIAFHIQAHLTRTTTGFAHEEGERGNCGSRHV